MITLTSLSFWLNFLLFLVAIYISFYIPGSILLRKVNVSNFHKVVLGTVVGMVLWAWQGFIFGYLHLRFLSYIYLIFVLILYIRNSKLNIKIPKSKKVDILVFLIFILGMFIQLAPVIGFGLEFSKGTYLCCANNDDFLYHAALTNSIIRGIPPMEPGMIGEVVRNYHYWSNLVVAELSRVFRLPAFFTQFQYINLFLSLFLGLTVLTFANLLKISKSFTRWLVFLIYFGGDGIFLILLFLGKNLSNLRSVLSLEDGSTFLYNPPRAFSIVIAFAALSLFVIWIRDKNKFAGALSIILFSSTVGFKVYTNLFFLIGLSILFIYFLYKKQYKNFVIGSLLFPLTGVIYLSDNASAGGLFWAPFHFANDFIVQSTFNLRNLELARQIFIAHNNYLRVFQYELLFIIISAIAVFGIKIIAFFQSFKSLLRLGGEQLIVLATGIIGSYFIGSFFLQQSGGANTFNFIVSSWIFLSIPAALALDFWQSKLSKAKQLIFILLFVVLTVPRVVNNTYTNVSQFMKFGYLFVDKDLENSFKFIKQNIDDKSLIVIDSTFDYDRYSPFVVAFTGGSTFLSGEKILESHNVPFETRQITKNNIFKAEGPLIAQEIYRNKINYLFLWQRDSSFSKQYDPFTNKLFENKEVKILKINESELLNTIK